MKATMENYFENEFARFSIKDKVLLVQFKADVILDLHTAQYVTSFRLRIHGGKSYPIYYDITGIRDSNKSGRDYFVLHYQLFAKAVSIYAGTKISFVLTRFYFRRDCTAIPCELFQNPEKALAFLENHK